MKKKRERKKDLRRRRCRLHDKCIDVEQPNIAKNSQRQKSEIVFVNCV